MEKVLMEIIIAINNLVGLFIVMRFFDYIFTKKILTTKVRNIRLITVLIVAITGNILTSELGIALVFAFIIYSIIAYCFYQARIQIKLIASVFFIIFSFVTELLAALLLTAVFGNVIQNIRQNTMYLFLGGVVSKIILMALTEVIIRYRSRNASKVTIGSWLLIVSIPIVSVGLAVISVYEPIITNSYSYVSVISCLSILYINIITFYLFDSIIIQVNENNQYRFRENVMRTQQEQYKNIIEGYNQVRKVRHDMVGHLITLDGYLMQNDYNKAVDYIHKLSDELDLGKRGVISNNVIVDALINNRKSRIYEEGIEFKDEMFIPRELKIDDMDLSIVLGNILNNAIEGCSRIKEAEKKKIIDFKMKYKRESLLIEMKNSCELNTIRQRDGDFISSKTYRENDEFGIGLGNVKGIVQKYNGIFQAELEGEMFVIKIVLPDINV